MSDSVSQCSLYLIDSSKCLLNRNCLMPLCDFCVSHITLSAIWKISVLPLCFAHLRWWCEGLLPHGSIFSDSFWVVFSGHGWEHHVPRNAFLIPALLPSSETCQNSLVKLVMRGRMDVTQSLVFLNYTLIPIK